MSDPKPESNVTSIILVVYDDGTKVPYSPELLDAA